jgi:hypothetical protein
LRGIRDALHELEPPQVLGGHLLIQDDLQPERHQVDVPGRDERIEERGAVLGGNVEEIGIEELEHDDPHRLVAPSAEPGHLEEPVVVVQLFLAHPLHHVEQLLRHQPLELAKWLLLEDRADECGARRSTLAQDQRPYFAEQRGGLVVQLALELELALGIRHLRQLARRELQEPVHSCVDVGPVRGGGRLLAGQQLGDVRLRDPGRAGEALLLQSEIIEPLPDRQRDIHARLRPVAT